MRAPRRKAFTLVELLVVIAIVGLLVALLFPAISGAIRTSRNAAVTTEFNILATKLEAFKVQYGEYPPSRIMLSEDGAWNISDATMIPVPGGGSDITYGQLAQRTVSYLRRFWPGMPISTTATPLFDGTGTFYDVDGDGQFDAPTVAGRGRVLDGTEALVFWLGGIPLNTGTTGDPQLSLSGFARGKFNFPGLSRPQPHPFRNNLENGNLAFGRDRDPVFHEFNAERLVDADSDGFPEFLDSLGTLKPIAWFKAEGNAGYDPNDCNLPEPDTSGAVPVVTRRFRVSFTNAAGGRDVQSPAPNPYTTNPANTGTTTSWHKPTSFQFISAGADGLYGPGGRYVPNAATFELKMPLEPTTAVGATTVQNLNTTDKDVRSVGRDNLVSFAGGTLD
jgi:general secretion pathway protein G